MTVPSVEDEYLKRSRSIYAASINVISSPALFKVMP
jgi:hypothetical protein